MKQFITYSVIGLLLVSCQYFKPAASDTVVARVNDTYLFESDVLKNMPNGLSKTDSVLFVQDYTNQWAKAELLVSGAERNLNEEKLEGYNRLVNQYKKDLYSNAYLEVLVNKNLDTLVSDTTAETYYSTNAEAFKLNENLIQFRYLIVNKDRRNLKELITQFRRFNQTDKDTIKALKIQFKSYAFNDSIWVKPTQVLHQLPVITNDNRNELLKKSNFVQLQDSLDLYLVQIKDVLLRGETAPLSYVRPTINQIVINKRKVDLLKQIESDITKDAIKNKKFELFN